MSEPETGDDDRTLVLGDSGGTTGGATTELDQSTGLDVSSRVGRYVVLEQLGRGGMGVVVRAYDPKLGREVALKVMRSDHSLGGSEAEARMLREAQALARLSHPNVVAVYDAELTDHGICIAMEYVQGRTLRAWMKQSSRPWPEVVEVVLAAAKGLAAAHAAGVVHRDIKPDNVLVGDDGRVRLTDFGVARAPAGPLSSNVSQSGEAGGEEHDEAELEPLSIVSWGDAELENLSLMASVSLQLTQVGAIVGTPAYMAPEQHGGGVADARSDQYALCVVLWEALFGRRPFKASNDAALLKAKRRGPPERPTSRVPEWIFAVVARGLAPEPEHRWSSVEVLVDALMAGKVRARYRRFALTTGVVACVVGAGLGWQHWQQSRRLAACERAGESITEVWNEDARSGVRTALVGTNLSYAQTTADKVMPLLDEQARAWQATRTEACLAANVEGTWDEDLLERGLWCLDEHRMELETLVAELSRGDAKSVETAVPAAAGLEPVAHCRSRELLLRLPSPPKEHREEVREVRGELSRARALLRTAAYEEAHAVANAALERATPLEWPPLVASARMLVGWSLSRMGDYGPAEQALEMAYFEAARAGVPALMVEIARRLVGTVGYRLARHEDGLRWSKHAEVALQSLPDVMETRRAKYLIDLASLHNSRGSHEEARALAEQALAIQQEVLGEDHVDVGGVVVMLGNAHQGLGNFDEAKEMYERALGIFEVSLGPEHPTIAGVLNNLSNAHQGLGRYAEGVELQKRAMTIYEKALGRAHPDFATSLNNLGNAYLRLGALDEAKRLHERALGVWERAFGSEHPHIAVSVANLASVHRAVGEYEEAKALYERALRIRESVFGIEHAEVAGTLMSLATVHDALGDYEEAKALHERAKRIQEATLGREHPDYAATLANLANVHMHLESRDEAEALYRRALEIWEKSLSAAHPYKLSPLVGLATIAVERRQWDEAISWAERAVSEGEAADAPAPDMADARFVLAQALWGAKKDRGRAVALARDTVQVYRQAGAGYEAALTEATTWLAQRRESK